MNNVFKLILVLFMLITFSIPVNAVIGNKVSSDKILYKPGELLIKLKKGVLINTIKGELNSKDFHVKNFFPHISKVQEQDIYLIKTDSNKLSISDTSISSEILNIEGIESISLNYAKTATAITNDPLFYQQWALNNTGQNFYGYGDVHGTAGVDINAPEIWRVSGGNSDVVVAVLDSGVDYQHEDLKESMWINSGEIAGNGIDDDGNGYIDDYHGYDFASNDSGDNDSDPMDITSINHGTHVAGIIAATKDNAIGVTGVAPGLKIMALKGFRPDGHIYLNDTIEALGYIVKMKALGVNIVAVNCSYGGTSSSDMERDIYSLVSNAGIIITAAAGNGDDDGNPINNDVTPHFPSSYEIPNLISIAAIDSTGILGSFSNFGSSSVDIGAPGVSIKSTVMTGTGSNPGSVSANNTAYTVLKMTFSKDSSGLIGNIYNCGKGLSASDFPSSVSGNIAIIERGDITFAEKATNAKNAGAAGVIIYNNIAGLFSGTLGVEGEWPVVVSISREDGLLLKAIEGSEVALASSNVSNYAFYNGTSMAAPHVAAAVGLIASVSPNQTVQQRYLRTLFCGIANDDLSLKSTIGSSLDLNSIFIQPVMGITGKRVENRSLLQTEYLDVISWQKNSQNFDHNISKYNIYKIEENEITFLGSVSSDITTYNNDDLSNTKNYTYIVVPVNSAGVFGEPATAFID